MFFGNFVFRIGASSSFLLFTPRWGRGGETKAPKHGRSLLLAGFP